MAVQQGAIVRVKVSSRRSAVEGVVSSITEPGDGTASTATVIFPNGEAVTMPLDEATAAAVPDDEPAPLRDFLAALHGPVRRAYDACGVFGTTLL
jgi:hypothetical protein